MTCYVLYFLTGRSQAVIIDGVKSELKEVTYGVPQGSVLGQFKFCNYLLSLGNIIAYCNSTICMQMTPKFI